MPCFKAFNDSSHTFGDDTLLFIKVVTDAVM